MVALKFNFIRIPDFKIGLFHFVFLNCSKYYITPIGVFFRHLPGTLDPIYWSTILPLLLKNIFEKLHSTFAVFH